MLEICRSRWSGCTSVIVSSKRKGFCISELTMSWQEAELSAASETAANATTSPAPSAITGSSRQAARSAGVVVNLRMSAPA